jgi:two-component system sensor histidine kinase BaeS
VIARWRLSPLGFRLTVAFVIVAVAAVAVLAALTLIAARTEVSDMVLGSHIQETQKAAAAAARAYEEADGWGDADLDGVLTLAAGAQARVSLRDADGHAVAIPSDGGEMLARIHGPDAASVTRRTSVTAPVIVEDHKVGIIALRFPTTDVLTPAHQVRDAMSRTVGLGVLLAIAVAIGIAVFVARRISRPITVLTTAASDLEHGRRDVQVGLADAPGELGALAAAFDRMATAVQREDELRRQLVHDVAHELRTPLAILQGTSEALLDGVTQPDQPTLASLHEEVLRLSGLVGDLETLAAAEAAGLRHQKEPFDLADIVGAAVAVARPAAEVSELRLAADLQPTPVVGDPARLGQAVTNLIANALRYTPSGGAIAIRTWIDEDGAHLEVTDTGPGIADGDLPHIFERFYRGAAARGTTGSGIGLAVATELAAVHHGRIQARNRATGGALFRLTLPAHESSTVPDARGLKPS